MTYRVEAIRTGEWWALSSPDVPGAHSQVKRLDQAESMAREAIALVLEVDESDITVEIHPVLNPELATLVDQVKVSRDSAAHAAELSAMTTRSTVRALLAAGLSMRDAGHVLGMSHQRIHQLARPDADQKVPAGR